MEGDDNDEEIESRFWELCGDVNMDKSTMELAWQSFKEAKTNYTLEGDCLHWLVCALFSACRQNLRSLQSVSGQAVKSNCISLTLLLHKAKVSFTSFLKKMEKWLQMNNDKLLIEHVGLLESNFRVSTVVFKKYLPVFANVFLDPDDPKHKKPKTPSRTPQRPHRSHRLRKIPCLPEDVFKFCWMLFIHAKGTTYRSISGEVLSSFQLLLCAINLCFKNALNCAHRTSLLNPDFSGLPSGWSDSGYSPADADDHDIIALLVKEHVAPELSTEEADQFLLETRVVSTHKWREYIASLQNPSILSGNGNDLLLPENFESNNKTLDRLYEEFVLTEGDLDERVFLQENVDAELGTPIKGTCPNGVAGGAAVATQQHSHQADNGEENLSSVPAGTAAQHQHKTPLTNREYLAGKDGRGEGGESAAGGIPGSLHHLHANSTTAGNGQSALKLRKLLAGKKAAPSDALVHIFNECSEDVATQISERLTALGEQFLQGHANECAGDTESNSRDIAVRRLMMAKIGYYHMLEKIMLQESKRLNGKGDLTALLKREDFNNLLFACCLEIVLHTFQSRCVFPWTLEALDLSPYYFYKVIELVIRAEDALAGAVIKHLIYVEEQILESLAWKADSPLWIAMTSQAGNAPPLCAEVNHAQNIETSTSQQHPTPSRSTPANHVPSPLAHPRVKQVVDSDVTAKVKTESTGSSAHDRFCSPSAGSAKRRLFTIPPVADPHLHPPVTDGSRNKTFLLQTSTSGSSSITLLPIGPPAKVETTSDGGGERTGGETKPKRTGSLALFYRKVYHLASVRLRHLCELLGISGREELRARIWTCFEHSISARADPLMKNRHIDQLLMCAVYVIAKITQHDQSFQEIMRCYRSQPQATSHVYRNVLIQAEPEERDDLIQFYNKVYVPVMRDFVKKFNPLGDSSKLEVPLSPMPLQRPVPQSPRRVSGTHNVYVSPMKSRTAMLTLSPSSTCYNFQRSPSKHLRDINAMIQQRASSLAGGVGVGGSPRGVAVNGKRSLAFADGEDDERAREAKRIALTAPRLQQLRNGGAGHHK